MGIKIEVTLNVKKCLEILQQAVESLPEGKEKENAKGALDYLVRTAEGEEQPMGGQYCPPDRPIVW